MIGKRYRRAIIYCSILALFLLSFISTTLILNRNTNTQAEVQKVITTNPPVSDKTKAVNTQTTNKDEKVTPQKAAPTKSESNKSTLKSYETRFEDIYIADGKKTAFLTFDDGPSSKVTPQILDVLKRYDIKGTFFVVGNQVEYNKNILKRVYQEGHSIALHSYSHDYKKIYSKLDAFKSDFEKSEKLVKSVLGKDFSTRIYRFPGGSFGSKKDVFKKYLNKIGYQYIDWNTLTGDTEYIVNSKGKKVVRSEPKALVNRFKETLKTASNKEDIVVLMHDLGSKQGTADALPGIIEYLKKEGYTFKVIK